MNFAEFSITCEGATENFYEERPFSEKKEKKETTVEKVHVK